MGKSDQWVLITVGFLILLHVSILAIGYFAGKLAYLAAIVNLAAGVSIILYWAIRQMQIEQHTVQTREMVVLLGEVLVISFAAFYIFSNQSGNWLKIVEYTFFGIHLFVLILGLIFMLTFKINRLI
jgi:hypothetical protein